jgi:menaquinone-specific isochorismate synthase
MILPITELNTALLSFYDRQNLSAKEGEILVHFAFKIEETDITSLMDPIISDCKKVFYFNRPEENLVIFAFQNAYSVKINGMNEFSALGDKISIVSNNLISNVNDKSLIKFPLFVGGTKFSSGSSSEEWKDFADNDWFIPQFLFYKKNKEHWFVLNFLVDKNYTAKDQINCQLEQFVKLTNNEFISTQFNTGLNIHSIEKEREEWDHLISDALNKIRDGLFRKVVLSRRITSEIKSSPSFHYILTRLNQNYQNCTVFLYKSENSVIFGATPEQLLKLKDSSLEFDALAGSAKRGDTEDDDEKIACSLLKDKKNSEEHYYVIDFIKESTSAYVNNLKQFDTGIKKFSNIQHLYTPIKAELNSSDQIYKLVDDIFPTPAICGSPKGTSYNYIINNEKFDRGLFSGIIGLISPGEMDLIVAIRSALLNDNKLYVYAGCGIVRDSDPASEFEETEIKMQPILSLFKNESK